MAYVPAPWPAACAADPAGAACGRAMATVCDGPTGQWVIPTCATLGCPQAPRSALLDPRSGCSAWRRAVELEDTLRWNQRNQCRVQIQTSLTEHCRGVCSPDWKRAHDRGRGYLVEGNCTLNLNIPQCEECLLEWYRPCPAGQKQNSVLCRWCESPCDAPECHVSSWTSATTVCSTYTTPAGVAFLDQAIARYCASPAGAASPECRCAVFPQVAAAWCDRGTLACPSTLAPADARAQCYATQFGYQTADAWELVEFSACDPYGCWFAPCQGSPEQNLIPSAVRETQLEGQCAGVCIAVSSSNSTDFPAGVSPLPPGAVEIDANVVRCGQPQNVPADLTMPPLVAVVPEDARFEQSVMVSNEGDFVAQFTVQKRSADWIAASPPSGVVGARSAAPLTVLWDRASLTAWGVGSSHTATLTLGYDDGFGRATASDLVFTVAIGPSVAPTVVTVTTLGPAALGVLGGVALGGLLFLGLGLGTAGRAARDARVAALRRY